MTLSLSQRVWELLSYSYRKIRWTYRKNVHKQYWMECVLIIKESIDKNNSGRLNKSERGLWHIFFEQILNWETGSNAYNQMANGNN